MDYTSCNLLSSLRHAAKGFLSHNPVSKHTAEIEEHYSASIHLQLTKCTNEQ